MSIQFGCALESVVSFLNAHTPKEYMPLKRFLAEDLQIANEGFGSNKANTALNSKYLSYQIGRMNKALSKVDFGNLDNTRGNITKWDKYESIVKIISLHPKITANNELSKDSSYSRINSVNTFLINQRADFEYGYKTNNEFIITVYHTLALSLMILGSITMVDQIRMLTNDNGSSFTSRRLSNKMRTFNKGIDNLMTVLNDGSWAKIVKGYKDMRVKPQMSLESVGAVVSVIGTVALMGVIGAVALVAIVSAIRGIISVYFNTLVKIDEQARSMEEYLKEIAPYETNPEALKKQEKAMTKLSSLAGFIEAKLLKADVAAENNIKAEDSKVTVDMLDSSSGDSYDFY